MTHSFALFPTDFMTADPTSAEAFGTAFDALVLSRETAPSFTEEASLVATFTRLYLRTVLSASEEELDDLLAVNLQLHAQARLFEESGIDPTEALHRQMRKGDKLGLVLRDYANHLGALDCLLDIRATAALVHHLVSMPIAEGLPNGLTGCEFGAGSGILSISGSIPFLAAGKRLTIHTYERDARSCLDLTRIGDLLRRHSRFGERLHLEVHQGDATTDAPFRYVAGAVAESGPLALWLSETFGHRTPTPVLDLAGNRCTFATPSGVVAYSADQEKRYDPFPEVLTRSCQFFAGFLTQVADGTLLAFPDLVTPRCILDGNKSALLGADGTWRKLHHIGAPYSMLPPCVPSRWFLQDSRPAAKSAKKAGPARKPRR